MKIKEEVAEAKIDAEPVASEAPGPSAEDADDQIPATQADPKESEDLLDDKVGFLGSSVLYLILQVCSQNPGTSGY